MGFQKPGAAEIRTGSTWEASRHQPTDLFSTGIAETLLFWSAPGFFNPSELVISINSFIKACKKSKAYSVPALVKKNATPDQQNTVHLVQIEACLAVWPAEM